MTVKLNFHHHHHTQKSMVCSICGVSFEDGVVVEAAEKTHPLPTANTISTATTTQQRHSFPPVNRNDNNNNIYLMRSMMLKGGLDSSFVTVPRALPISSSSYGSRKNSLNYHPFQNELNGMYESSQRIDTFLESISDIIVSYSLPSSLSRGSISTITPTSTDVVTTKRITCEDNVKEDAHQYEDRCYCQTCLTIMGQVLDACSEQFDEECITFDKVASCEEERALLMHNAISTNADTIVGICLDDDANNKAINHVMETFQAEINNLSLACHEQEKELRELQKLMQIQIDRSNDLSNKEDCLHQELNSLQIHAHNFEEESHLILQSCHAMESEIASLSRVKLLSIPFQIHIQYDKNFMDNTALNEVGGRYPTINNLRLAYRINTSAGLYREEINAAFFNVAQLLTFILGMYYPDFNTSILRIIPIHPCAKILVKLPEGQTIHNLGFDTSHHRGAPTSEKEGKPSNHVPTQSITLFLALLSEVILYITTERKKLDGANVDNDPPFPMTQTSIDSVDVVKLADSNVVAWSSVIFCIAANLQWLSELVW